MGRQSNKIDGFYFLKIDTEGHDYYILKKFINDIEENTHLPFKLQFFSRIVLFSTFKSPSIFPLILASLDSMFPLI